MFHPLGRHYGVCLTDSLLPQQAPTVLDELRKDEVQHPEQRPRPCTSLHLYVCLYFSPMVMIMFQPIGSHYGVCLTDSLLPHREVAMLDELGKDEVQHPKQRPRPCTSLHPYIYVFIPAPW